MPQETVSIQVGRQTAEAIQAQAKARGLSIEDYLQFVVKVAIVRAPSNGGAGTIESPDVDRWLGELAAPLSSSTPSLPADFSRGDIYAPGNRASPSNS